MTNENKDVILERRRATDYLVNFNTGFGKPVPYLFAGAKHGRPSKRPVPFEVYDWLVLYTDALKNGELILAEDNGEDTIKDLVTGITDEELKEISDNSHSYEEIQAILEGNINTMKSKLKKITQLEEKRFVVKVMNDIKAKDGFNDKKEAFIKEWAAVEFEVQIGIDPNSGSILEN